MNGTKERRVLSIILTLLLALSMTFGSFAGAFAETEEAAAPEADSVASEEAGETGELSGDESLEALAEAEESLEDVVAMDEEPESTVTSGPEEEDEAAGAISVQGEESQDLPGIAVVAQGDENFITVTWKAAEKPDFEYDAAYYMVYLDGDTAGVKVLASADRKWVFKNVTNGTHEVTVEAYREVVEESAATDDSENNTGDAEGDTTGNTQEPEETYEKFAEGSALDISSALRPKIGNGNKQVINLGASQIGPELRSAIGEGHSGYAVTQGAATDGTYGYFLMVKPVDGVQPGRIVKMRLSDGAIVACGPAIDINHGNGMTYDTKRNMIVINQRGARRNRIVYVNPNSLTIERVADLQYPYEIDGVYSYTGGIAAIAYVEKYDVYLARARGQNDSGTYGDNRVLNNIWVFDAKTLNAIGHIHTTIVSDYPSLYQSMAADEKYVYFLLSPGSGQSRNIILALDWNSENLLPVVNGEKDYVEKKWYCNNSDSAKPDAVLRIPISHEAEGLMMVKDKTTGKARFYVSEYYGRAHYKTVTKKVKLKRKKWKKIRKWYNKKTKKWTTKKPPKKYRGKSKKVWKKYKKKKVKVQDYWARSNYVYYIGTF